ncbi:MAG: hypothetical protein IBX69_04550 [Anaerolineales bacterium]|nr:hypothetical protein [Anaerolineales bacterium]
MIHAEPVRIIVFGFVLVLLGFILAFLMTIGIIAPTFLLGLVTYLSSFGGLFIGIMGSALYVRDRRRQDREE